MSRRAGVASYAYVNPVAALLLGAWVGGESLTMRQGLACGVIIAGVLVTMVGRPAGLAQRKA